MCGAIVGISSLVLSILLLALYSPSSYDKLITETSASISRGHHNHYPYASPHPLPVLTNGVIFISSASSYIVRSTAEALASYGYHVLVGVQSKQQK